MGSRVASCHCNRLVISCMGDSKKISMCHCLDCQRRTGSLFSVAVFFERDRIHLLQGEPNSYERGSDSGFPVRFHFCGDCGSNVYWEPARMPTLIGVAVGAFADPAFPLPHQAVYVKHKHSWLVLPVEITAYEERPSATA